MQYPKQAKLKSTWRGHNLFQLNNIFMMKLLQNFNLSNGCYRKLHNRPDKLFKRNMNFCAYVYTPMYC